MSDTTLKEDYKPHWNVKSELLELHLLLLVGTCTGEKRTDTDTEGQPKVQLEKETHLELFLPSFCILFLRQRFGQPFSHGLTLGPHKWGLPFYLSLPSCIPLFLYTVFFTASQSLSFRTFMHLWITAWWSTRREPELLLSVLRLKPGPYGEVERGEFKAVSVKELLFVVTSLPPSAKRGLLKVSQHAAGPGRPCV